jgi:hypothetical protein
VTNNISEEEESLMDKAKLEGLLNALGNVEAGYLVADYKHRHFLRDQLDRAYGEFIRSLK